MDVNAALFGALVGLPFGVLASALAWWGVFHGFRPKLQWTDSVEEVPAGGLVADYAVSFRNLGRRTAVEVHTHAHLRIKGVIPTRPTRWLVVEIPTNNTFIPQVEPYRRTRRKTIVVLLLNEIRSGDLRRLPGEIAEGITSGRLGLRELLQVGEQADLTLAATCTDSFSGARHPYCSRRLTVEDLDDSG